MTMEQFSRLVGYYRDGIWNTLDSVQIPLFGVSLLVLFLAVFVFNVVMKFLSVLTGNRHDEQTGGRLDNNNYYIYRR